VRTAFVCPLHRCARRKSRWVERVRKGRRITSLPKTKLIGPIVACPESRLRPFRWQILARVLTLDVLSIVQPLDRGELFYMERPTNGRLMAVDVKSSGSSFEA